MILGGGVKLSKSIYGERGSLVTEEVNRRVVALWENKFSDSAYDVEWMPLVYPPLRKESILFIGLNPSFSDTGFRTILADTPYISISSREFFHWRNRSKFDIATAIAIESVGRIKYCFFAKFIEISDYMQIPWEHIDLFFYRETNQNKFKRFILKNDGITEFGSKQLELSKILIKEARPQIIVVANALASKIFKEEFDLKFDEELGCYVMALNEQPVPVFLASMLTGQRAMDTYSYERLKWHIRYVHRRAIIRK